jgi:hypothetical protein
MPRYTCESPLLLGGFKRLDFVRLTQLFPMHDIESSSHFVTCDSYVRNKGNTMSKSSYCEMVIEKSCLKSLGPRIWGGIVINHEIPRNCIEIVHFGILNKSTRILKVGETWMFFSCFPPALGFQLTGQVNAEAEMWGGPVFFFRMTYKGTYPSHLDIASQLTTGFSNWRLDDVWGFGKSKCSVYGNAYITSETSPSTLLPLSIFKHRSVNRSAKWRWGRYQRLTKASLRLVALGILIIGGRRWVGRHCRVGKISRLGRLLCGSEHVSFGKSVLDIVLYTTMQYI